MIEPAFEFSNQKPPIRSPILGWIAVTTIILLLAMQQFVGYIDRAAPSKAPLITDLDSRLKMIVKSAAMEKAILKSASLPSQSKPQGRPEASESTKRDLAELAKDIKPHLKEENSYRLLYAIVQYERGETPDAGDLKALERDGSPRRAAAAKIYGFESLTKEEVAELSKPFTGKFFADKLVKIHAHEKSGDLEYRSQTLQKGAVGLGAGVVVLVLAFFVGCILLLGYLVARGLGHWKPLGHPSGTLTFAQADANAMRTALMLVGLFGGQIVVILLLGSLGLPTEFKAAISFGLSLAFMIYVIRAPIHGFRLTFDQVGLHSRDLGKNVLWGIGASLANLPIILVAAIAGNVLTKWFPPAHHPIQDELGGATGITTVILFVAAAIFAPIFEEIAFRGTFLPALSRRFGSVPLGIFMCGVCFAIIHPTGIPAWPPLAAIGMMAASVTYQRRSLVPAIIMHAVHNGAILAFSLIALS